LFPIYPIFVPWKGEEYWLLDIGPTKSFILVSFDVCVSNIGTHR